MTATRDRLSRAERKARTREDLLDAAHAVFTRDGFHAASLDRVAAEAGYTKGAVYSNFASKEDLFLALYERRVDRTVEEMERLLAGASGVEGPLRLNAATFARLEDGWRAVFFEFWAHVLRRPDLRERFARAHARAREPIRRDFERHVLEAGLTPPLPADDLTAAMWAMTSGLVLETLTDPAFDGGAVADRMSRLILDAIDTDGGTD